MWCCRGKKIRFLFVGASWAPSHGSLGGPRQILCQISFDFLCFDLWNFKEPIESLNKSQCLGPTALLRFVLVREDNLKYLNSFTKKMWPNWNIRDPTLYCANGLAVF